MQKYGENASRYEDIANIFNKKKTNLKKCEQCPLSNNKIWSNLSVYSLKYNLIRNYYPIYFTFNFMLFLFFYTNIRDSLNYNLFVAWIIIIVIIK